MKEKFQTRKLHGAMNVACKYDDGSVRYWTDRKEVVVQRIVQIVNSYSSRGYILTLRQLHYQLVTRNWIINHDTAYKKLGSILDDCRYSGVVDWDAIEDRGRVPYIPYSVDGVDEAIQDMIDTFRRDRQENQRNVVELWTEKDALSGILKRTTEKYHIRLVVNKGYTSSSAIYRAYERMIENYENERRTIILYFGDHDPSGLDMIRDIEDRLTFMITNGNNSEYCYPNDVFEMKQIGLNLRQIRELKLPQNPTKLTDTRSIGYVKLYGKICWEVDALSPEVLTQIVEDNILDNIDEELFDEKMEEEKNNVNELKRRMKL